MIIIINYLCHHYCYWHVCWLWLGLLALRPSVLSFFTECDIFFYYKARQELLQSATAFFLQSTTYVITKCGSFFYYRLRLYFIRKLRKDVMTKCNRYYKVRQLFIKKLRQFYYKVWQVLQNATGTIKCYVYFKVRPNNWPPSPHTISISRAQQSQPFETSQFHKSKEIIGNITP